MTTRAEKLDAVGAALQVVDFEVAYDDAEHIGAWAVSIHEPSRSWGEFVGPFDDRNDALEHVRTLRDELGDDFTIETLPLFRPTWLRDE